MSEKPSWLQGPSWKPSGDWRQGPSWTSASSSTSTSSLETAEERDRRLREERRRREEEERRALEQKMQSWRTEAQNDISSRSTQDLQEMDRMAREFVESEERLKKIEQWNSKEWDEFVRSSGSPIDMNMDGMAAKHDQELEEYKRRAQEHLERLREQEANKVAQRSAHALKEQRENPLGILYGREASGGPSWGEHGSRANGSQTTGSSSVAGDRPPPFASGANTSSTGGDAPPAYDAPGSSAAARPPPYSTADTEKGAKAIAALKAHNEIKKEQLPDATRAQEERWFSKIMRGGKAPTKQKMSDMFEHKPMLETKGFMPSSSGKKLRCDSCFDLIVPDPEHGFSGQVTRDANGTYHEECYIRRAGPKCYSCSETLFPHVEKGLSGLWGVYKGHNYHVECYQYVAGPRCAICLDVIFADPAKGFSGFWRQMDDGQFLHEECYTKRLHERMEDVEHVK